MPSLAVQREFPWPLRRVQQVSRATSLARARRRYPGLLSAHEAEPRRARRDAQPPRFCALEILTPAADSKSITAIIGRLMRPGRVFGRSRIETTRCACSSKSPVSASELGWAYRVTPTRRRSPETDRRQRGALEGDLKPGEAREVLSPTVAERRARALALEHAGAVAFSRTGDPTTGEFQDAVILARFGEADLNSLGE